LKFSELRSALALFGLGERATLRQVKLRYRQRVKENHPDLCPDEDSEQIKDINQAYRLLLDYCSNYRFCFSEEEFLEQYPEERLRRQFGWDPVWSGEPEHKG